MEQIANLPPQVATDEPTYPSTARRALAAVPVPAQLSDDLVEDAVEAGLDSGRPGWTPRIDGWTPDRIRAFLDRLSQCGVVSDAARAAGMSVQGAYAFRHSARGRAFGVAWRAAQLLARERLADAALSRAMHGCVEVIIRDGVVMASATATTTASPWPC